MDQFSGGQGAFHFRSSALGPELRSAERLLNWDLLNVCSTLSASTCVFFHILFYWLWCDQHVGFAAFFEWSPRASRSASPTLPSCAALPCWSPWFSLRSTSGGTLRTTSRRKTAAGTAGKAAKMTMSSFILHYTPTQTRSPSPGSLLSFFFPLK